MVSAESNERHPFLSKTREFKNAHAHLAVLLEIANVVDELVTYVHDAGASGLDGGSSILGARFNRRYHTLITTEPAYREAGIFQRNNTLGSLGSVAQFDEATLDMLDYASQTTSADDAQKIDFARNVIRLRAEYVVFMELSRLATGNYGNANDFETALFGAVSPIVVEHVERVVQLRSALSTEEAGN